MQSGNSPLRLLQHVSVESMPAGKRKLSPNARTIYSNYFIPKGSPRFWSEGKKFRKTRYYATITILGDQRPYKLEFVVVKELKVRTKYNVTYKEVGRSLEAAKALAKYFRQNLEKSLKDRNFVDDFRVF